MKIYENLELLLKSQNDYVTDEGELKKWVVISKAQNHDKDLVALLVGDEEAKAQFFEDVSGALVFRQGHFIRFLEQKNYLNDSFTAFRNKVGFNIDGKYIGQRNEVSLVWPFKDCILEGGQSHDEHEREEIFFNEILAQDEITQLLEPKVLANARRYDSKGDSEAVDIERDAEMNKARGLPEETITDNLLIKGNNLLALHSISEAFSGRVKAVYIDPPYNTGSDEFLYNDRFNHSTWLTFMRNRLIAVKPLLTQEGAVYISIDINEVGFLQVLCDEIFGRENRCGIVTVKRGSATGHKAINAGVINLSEYLMIYAVDKAKWNPNRVYKARGRNDRYSSFILNREKSLDQWDFCSLLDAFASHKGIAKTKLKKELGASFEPEIYAFVKDNADCVIQFAYPDEDKVSKEAAALISKSRKKENAGKVFHLPRDGNLDIYIKEGQRLLFYSDRLMEIDGELVTAEPISDIWDDVLPNDLHNEGGVKLKKGKKPEKLLKRIIELSTNENDIILDYHLGSGTSCAVAHKMKRQYVGIEQLDYGPNDSLVRLQNVVGGDASGISKAVNWRAGGSFVRVELKRLNEAFAEQIENAKNTKALLKTWATMKARSFLNYNIDLKRQEEHIDEFKALKLDDQKAHLMSLLDKNQLYVSLSSMEDQDFNCSNKDKAFTRNFYRIDN